MNTRALALNANVLFIQNSVASRGIRENAEVLTGRGGEIAPFVLWMSVLFVG